MDLLPWSNHLKLAETGSVVTIGNFDGVHTGHRAVIELLADTGKQLGLPVCVVLFEPQPLEYFNAKAAPARLMRLREKLIRLAELPVDHVVLLRFNRSLAGMSPEAFIQEVLIDCLHVRYLVIGDDFRFGKNRRGNFALLKEVGAQNGFEVSDTASVLLEGERVSSTLIREALAQGDLTRAERLLGRPYSICGRIIHGRKLGRDLGFPTANINIQRKNTPLQGVFAVTMSGIDSKPMPGVANIGFRPTVSGTRTVVLEVHLLDFSADLYGKKVDVTFLKKLRDEHKFNGISELRDQIEKDVNAARRYFAEEPNIFVP